MEKLSSQNLKFCLCKDHLTLKLRLDKYKEKLNSKNLKYRNLLSVCKKRERSKKRLEGLLNKVMESYQELKEMSNSNVLELEKELDMYQMQREEIDDLKKELNKIHNLENENVFLIENLQDCQYCIQTKNFNIKQLEKDMEMFREESLQKQDLLKATIIKMEKYIAQCEENLCKYENSNELYAQEKKCLCTYINKLEIKVQDYKSALDFKNNENKILLDKLQNEKNQKIHLQKEFDITNIKDEQSRKLLEHAMYLIESIGRRLEDYDLERLETQRDHKRKISDLENQINCSNSTIKELRDNLKKMKEAMDKSIELRTVSAQLHDVADYHMARLEASNQDLMTESSYLKEIYNQLKGEFGNLEGFKNEVTVLKKQLEKEKILRCKTEATLADVKQSGDSELIKLRSVVVLLNDDIESLHSEIENLLKAPAVREMQKFIMSLQKENANLRKNVQLLNKQVESSFFPGYMDPDQLRLLKNQLEKLKGDVQKQKQEVAHEKKNRYEMITYVKNKLEEHEKQNLLIEQLKYENIQLKRTLPKKEQTVVFMEKENKDDGNVSYKYLYGLSGEKQYATTCKKNTPSANNDGRNLKMYDSKKQANVNVRVIPQNKTTQTISEKQSNDSSKNLKGVELLGPLHKSEQEPYLKTINNQDRQIKNLEKQIDEKLATIEEQNRQVKDFEKQIKHNLDERNILKQQIQDLENKNLNFDTVPNSSQVSWLERLNAQNQQIKHLEDQIVRIEEEKQKLNIQKIQDLNEQNKKTVRLEEQIARNEEENRNLNRQVNGLNAQNKQIADLEEQLVRSDDEKQKLNKQVNDLTNKIVTTRDNNEPSKIRNALELEQKRNSDLEKIFNECREIGERMKTRVQELECENLELKESLKQHKASIKVEPNRDVSAWEKKINDATENFAGALRKTLKENPNEEKKIDSELPVLLNGLKQDLIRYGVPIKQVKLDIPKTAVSQENELNYVKEQLRVEQKRAEEMQSFWNECEYRGNQLRKANLDLENENLQLNSIIKSMKEDCASSKPPDNFVNSVSKDLSTWKEKIDENIANITKHVQENRETLDSTKPLEKELLAQISALREQLTETTNGKIDKVSETMQKHQLADLHNKLTDISNENKKLRNEIVDLKQANKEQKVNSEIEDSLQNALDSQRKSNVGKVKIMEDRISELQTENNRLRNDTGILRSKKSTVSVQMLEMLEKRKSLGERVSISSTKSIPKDKDARIRELEAKLQELQDTYTGDIENLKGIFDSIQEKGEDEENCEFHDSIIKELELQLKDAMSANEALTDENTQLVNENNRLLKSTSGDAPVQNNEDTKMQNLMEHLRELQNRNEILRTRTIQLELDNGRMKADLERLMGKEHRTIEKELQKLKELEKQLSKVQKRYNDLKKRLIKIEIENKNLKMEYIETLIAKEKILLQYKDQTKRLRETGKLLRKTTEKKSSLIVRIVKLQVENDTLRRQLDSMIKREFQRRMDSSDTESRKSDISLDIVSRTAASMTTVTTRPSIDPSITRNVVMDRLKQKLIKLELENDNLKKQLENFGVIDFLQTDIDTTNDFDATSKSLDVDETLQMKAVELQIENEYLKHELNCNENINYEKNIAEDKIQELEEELQRLTESNEQLRATILELEVDNEFMRNELQKLVQTEEVDDSNMPNQDLEKQNHMLKMKVDNLENDNKNLKQELANLGQEQVTLEAHTRNKILKEIEVLLPEFQDLRNIVYRLKQKGELKSEVDEIEDRLNVWKGQYAPKLQELKGNLDRITGVGGNIATKLESSLRECKKKVEKMDEENKRMKITLDLLYKDMDESTTRRVSKAVEQEMVEYKDKSSMQRALIECEEKKKELEKQLEECQKLNTLLRVEKFSLESHNHVERIRELEALILQCYDNNSEGTGQRRSSIVSEIQIKKVRELEQQIFQLHSNLDTVTNEKNGLQKEMESELESYIMQNHRLQKELLELKNDLYKRTDSVISLDENEDLESLKKKYKQLYAKFEESRRRIAELEEQLKKCREVNKDLKKRTLQTEIKEDDFPTGRDNNDLENSGPNNGNDKQTDLQIEQLSKENGELRKELISCKKSIEELNYETNKHIMMEEENFILKEKLVSSENTNKILKNYLNKLQQDNIEVIEEIEINQRRNEHLEKKIEILEREQRSATERNAEKTLKIETLENSIILHEKEIKSLKEEAVLKEKEVQNMKQVLQKYCDDNTRLNKRLLQLDKELNKRQAKNEISEIEDDNQRKRTKEMEVLVHRCQIDNETLRSTIIELEREIKFVRKDMKVLREYHKKVNQEIPMKSESNNFNFKNMVVKLTEEYEEKINALKKQLQTPVATILPNGWLNSPQGPMPLMLQMPLLTEYQFPNINNIEQKFASSVHTLEHLSQIVDKIKKNLDDSKMVLESGLLNSAESISNEREICAIRMDKEDSSSSSIESRIAQFNNHILKQQRTKLKIDRLQDEIKETVKGFKNVSESNLSCPRPGTSSLPEKHNLKFKNIVSKYSETSNQYRDSQSMCAKRNSLNLLRKL